MIHLPYRLIAGIDTSPLPGSNATSGTIKDAFNIVLAIAGSIALLIIVIAGLQYVLSQGNPQTVAKAKNAIIYAFVGLIICLIAFVIVGFVIGNTT